MHRQKAIDRGVQYRRQKREYANENERNKRKGQYFSFVSFIFVLSLPFQQPAEIAARFNRAVELQRQGAFEAAAAEYRAIIKSAPDYAEAHANLGAVMSRLGKYDEAVTAYEAALRLNPQLTPILLNLGIAHYRAEQFAKAAEALERFLSAAQDNIQARQLLGVSLIALGRDADGIAQLEPVLDATDDPTALYSLGLAYLRLNRPEVSAIISRLTGNSAGIPLGHLLRGQWLLNRLEVKQAAVELEEAAKFNPDLPRLQYSLGLSYLKLGRSQDALACFERELRQTPQDFSTLYYLAYVQELSGKLDAARGRIVEALKLEPQSPEANALLAKVLFKLGRAAEAVAPLEAALAKDPTDSEKRYLLGRIYHQLGRRQDAAREFTEVQRQKNEAIDQEKTRRSKP
jgi:tetratricopeptide (TPR) repeat protein